ncbi:MAG: cell division protein SepF [Firmicutes bacterium]|nr:cell division protein SepF [Bacillota bacterium]
MERLLNFLGFVAEEAEVDEEDFAEEGPSAPPRRSRPRVVSLQSAQRQFKVVVFEPKTFEEVQGAVDQLKNHRPVIINLEETERAVARRIVDFMSGATYALAGGMQKISVSIFLFTPPEVEITLGPRAEPRDRSNLFNL